MKAMQERFKDKPSTMFQDSIASFRCDAGCAMGDVIAESIIPTLSQSHS